MWLTLRLAALPCSARLKKKENQHLRLPTIAKVKIYQSVSFWHGCFSATRGQDSIRSFQHGLKLWTGNCRTSDSDTQTFSERFIERLGTNSRIQFKQNFLTCCWMKSKCSSLYSCSFSNVEIASLCNEKVKPRRGQTKHAGNKFHQNTLPVDIYMNATVKPIHAVVRRALTFVTTTRIGIPRLWERVVSPSGSNTLSSSVLEAAGCRGFGWVLRGPLVVLPSIGSVYSWNCRTTVGGKKPHIWTSCGCFAFFICRVDIM